jgi:hypothetical protein
MTDVHAERVNPIQTNSGLSLLETAAVVLAVRVPGYRSRGTGIDSRRYQIFREVVGLERGPLGLVSTTEEIREKK